MIEYISAEIAGELSKKYPFAPDYYLAEIPQGWLISTITMLRRLDNHLKESEIDGFKLTNLKEKFGHGAFSASFLDDTIIKIMDEWAEDTYKTCCMCGKTATKYTQAWIRPYCSSCYENTEKFER